MLQQLKDLIDSGGDIEFSVCGKKYTILPWTDSGIVIGPQGSDDDQTFPSSDDLLDGYLIDGKPLRKLNHKIKILFHS